MIMGQEKQAKKIPVTPAALSRKAAAQILGLSVRTIDQALSDGRLHAKRYGGRVLIPAAEVERFLEQMDDR
jgi:excisionase family DNA binding protein